MISLALPGLGDFQVFLDGDGKGERPWLVHHVSNSGDSAAVMSTHSDEAAAVLAMLRFATDTYKQHLAWLSK